jgi:crossover junction endodeoxyribonuclease RuvC
MTSPLVVGLDLSLTSTGWARCRGGNIETGLIRSEPLPGLVPRTLPWFRSSLVRIADLQAALLTVTGAGTPGAADLIVVEGPSLGSKGSALDRMFGLWWLCLQTLFITGQPVAVVTPSQLQRFMTGKGRAAKPEVMAAVIKRLPGDVTCFDDADALALAAMGCHHLGVPLAPMPATHLQAMSKVDWPITERITTDA